MVYLQGPGSRRKRTMPLLTGELGESGDGARPQSPWRPINQSLTRCSPKLTLEPKLAPFHGATDNPGYNDMEIAQGTYRYMGIIVITNIIIVRITN